jgi:transcriptional regulator with XRE-family HTH domain
MAKVSEDLSPITQRVLDLMEAQGIHKRKVRSTLVKACGVTGSAVYQWFTTTKTINPEHLLSIAKEFGTTVDWLLTGEAQIALEPGPAGIQTGSKNPVASNLIGSTRDEILALAKNLESSDTQTTVALLKIAKDLDEAREILLL